MGTTGLGEGHEKTGTGATWQSDGLRDTDILSTATLTNFVEQGLGNGVIPITLNVYSADSGGSDRNNPIGGNCCVRKNTGGTLSFFVDVGTVALDGMFYTVGSASSLDINTAALYNARFNAGWTTASLPNAPNEEAWVLVIVDPENNTNHMSLVCGQKVDVSGGMFPQMPSSQLVKQSSILAAIRVTNGPVVTAVEDKRAFIRGGPIPLTKLVRADGNPAYPENDLITTPAINSANLPIAGLGMLFNRDPIRHSASVTAVNPNQQHGAGQSHLFYQGDIAIGGASGGAYQLTPVHRQHIQTWAYTGPTPAPYVAIFAFTPLVSEIDSGEHLVLAIWYAANHSQSCVLHEGVHFAISGNQLIMFDLAVTATNPHTSAGIAVTGYIKIHYTHSGF